MLFRSGRGPCGHTGGSAKVRMVQEGAARVHASAGFRLLGWGGLSGSSGPTACMALTRPRWHGIKASVALRSFLSENEVSGRGSSSSGQQQHGQQQVTG